ncbi:MAG TPA: complex I NDUFA9 subunit family protein [Gammaproteobacteria bacterium]|nr:complex I NDUFA9 subunit family protein [Gammaproteobacteria bacterium]
MSRVCILGGSGFVGQRLAARLVERGHSVKVLTRRRFRHRELLVLPTLELVEADVYDAGVLRREFEGMDAVVNLVGILNERGHSGAGFRLAHVELTEGVLQACRGARVRRLLHMSALNADKHGPSHYLRTKGEAAALVLAAKQLETAVFEPSVIFGPGDSFLTRFAALLQRVPLVFPLAFPKARFAPVYVGDVAEAFARCLESRPAPGQRYPLCGPRVYSLKQLVGYAAGLCGRRRLILGLPRPAAWLQAALMEWLPGKPFSLDNYRSLTKDSVSDEDGLAELHIAPTPLEAVAPLYLAR